MPLTFVTLDTGDIQICERAEADDGAVRHAGDVLRRALHPPATPTATAELLPDSYVRALDIALAAMHPAELHPPPDMRLPTHPSPAQAELYRSAVRRAPLSGWTLDACSLDGLAGLLATVYRPAAGLKAPVSTFAVARDDFAGEPLWRRLHAGGHGRGPVATDPGLPPPAPWLGVRLEIGAALPEGERQPSDLAALADVERLIAWAWLETTRVRT
ncbi:hypothetical protein [Methylosinus sp. Sm6]|uniref:hypothetical protein n=1 Tax=Methylosinus sp. Sm6 TaxID=2866948 RepID=UPI001C9A24B7|nr:hypothetical protein [Methylosinus sp. Sm6]MBY6242215.1 hypothetical protein [Methylosinus sp. Sm6]